jgi:catechol 2,3-dioxygenase-like lactoylglutathione lyase family enzyme
MASSIHHIALACRDVEETHRFYGELLGLRLVHTEVQAGAGGAVRHFFYDLGDGSCIAFFDLHNVGEPEPLETAISTGLGLPVWVNHIALRRDLDDLPAIKANLQEHGVVPTMEADHGWCTSLYYTDPNGILIEFCADTTGMPIEEEEAQRLLAEPVTS